MPTYQYACTTCGEQVEAVQRFDDEPLSVCPACGGSLRKVFSPVGIVFKGSGFYHTDSRQRATAAKSDGARDGKVKESAGSAENASKDSSSASGSSSADAKKPAGSKSSQPVGASSSAR